MVDSVAAFCSGMASNAFCRWWHNEIGDLLRRTARCPARNDLRQGECPQLLLRQVEENPHDPLFTCGVPNSPTATPHPPEREYHIAAPPSDGALASGNVYTDGALRGSVPSTRREGWAYSVVNEAEATWGRYGTMGDLYPTALRAERRAANGALRRARHHTHGQPTSGRRSALGEILVLCTRAG